MLMLPVLPVAPLLLQCNLQLQVLFMQSPQLLLHQRWLVSCIYCRVCT